MKLAITVNIWDERLGSGATSSVTDLVPELVRRGIQVIVLTTSDCRSIQTSKYLNVKIYYLPPHNLYWVGNKDRQGISQKVIWQIIDIWNPLMFLDIYKILRIEQPDVIHVHKMRGLSTAIWSAARHAGVSKIIQTCQDYELLSPEGTLASRIGRWSDSGQWFMQPYIRLRARLSRAITSVTCPSRYTLDKLLAHGFFAKSRQKIIRNSHGIKQEYIDKVRSTTIKRKLQTINKTIDILFMGRLEKIKGIDWFCSLFATHRERWPNLRLHVAGDGSLKGDLIRRFGHHDQISFHGWLTGERKEQLLSQSHLLVTPSIYEEISPVVIAEAYAHGIPVLGSNIGGIPELICGGKTGWYLKPESVSDWVQILDRIHQYPNLLKDMFENCFEKSSNFSPEKVAGEYIDLYFN